MYVADQGFVANDRGLLSEDSFVRLRAQIETTQPLTLELEAAEEEMLPRTQRLWSKMKVLIDECFAKRRADKTLMFTMDSSLGMSMPMPVLCDAVQCSALVS